MTTLATRALIMAVVPEWSEKLNVLLFDAAEKLLADAQAMAPATDDARQLLALLAWISDLEQFASERGGMTTPLQLFRYEQNITGLLQRWDTAAPQHEPMMIRISHSVPAFEAIRARVSSYLRILRNDKTVHLQAIDELKQTLSRHMLEGKGATALDVLTRFAQHYPKIGGIEPLRADLTQLSVMQQAVQDHKLSSVLHLYKTEYATPLVTSLAAQWSAEHLPATKDLARYQAALAAWDKGHSDIAATLLQPLTGLTWGAMATARLEHFRNITRAFGQLRAGRQQNDYGDRLLAFHQLLDPLEDRFFSAAIATDMEQYRERALNVAGSALVRAREQWAAYQDDGRISSMMRLEKPVSEAFKTQSRRLLESYRNITSAVHTHELLKQPYSDDDRRLYDEVMSESKRQRQWLTDLGLVLDPAVLQVKLKLLPDPEGS
jgi:hypothetical protein